MTINETMRLVRGTIAATALLAVAGCGYSSPSPGYPAGSYGYPAYGYGTGLGPGGPSLFVGRFFHGPDHDHDRDDFMDRDHDNDHDHDRDDRR